MTWSRRIMLLLTSCVVGPVSAEPPPSKSVTDVEVRELQNQLSLFAYLRGLTPEQLKALQDQYSGIKPSAPPTPGVPKIAKNANGINVEPVTFQGPPRPEQPSTTTEPPNSPVPQADQIQSNPFRGGPLPDIKPENLPGNFDPRFPNNPGAADLIQFWEKSFGPLDRTPEIRDAIYEMLNAPEFRQNKDFGDLLKDLKSPDGDVKDFGDWFKDAFGNDKIDWKLPQFDGAWQPNAPNLGTPAPSGGSGWGGFGSFSAGGDGSWWPVIVLVGLVVVGLVVWKLWPMIVARQSSDSAAERVRQLGRWPIDPRRVSTREDVVRAFEYLSVLLCGNAARVWNHQTIAAALRAKIPASELVADELAAVYEMARYSPPDEPLSTTSIQTARRCLCELAGVTA